jgi:hypothetical protein
MMRYQIHSHKNQHPGQPRSFTAREYARMQGFPDTHYLCGTHEKKFEQVGNAVCARLALNIGKAMCIGAQADKTDSPLRLETPCPGYWLLSGQLARRRSHLWC